MILQLLFWSVVTLILAVTFYVAKTLRQNAAFLASHNIPYLGSGLGKFTRLILGKLTMAEMELEIYKESSAYPDHSLVGAPNFGLTMGLYTRDLDLVRNIFVKDFDHFVDRRSFKAMKSNSFLKSALVAMEGEQWRSMRRFLSPAFTTGKIRNMFEIFREKSECLVEYVKAEAGTTEGNQVDFCQAFPKFAMDVIASCAFGLDSQCFNEKVSSSTSGFLYWANKFLALQTNPMVLLRFVITLAAPRIAGWFNVEIFDPEIIRELGAYVKNGMKHRRETGERRQDFLQLLMDVQEGLLKDDQEENKENIEVGKESEKLKFDDDDVVANCLQFLIGGLDPTKSLLLFAVYALALEPEVQEKLWREIEQKLEEHGGKMSYEAVQEMTYLDLVINETLRFYPPTARTERKCTKDYPVPGMDFVIPEGTIVGIPFYPVHHDPKYYENPERFDPDRFLPERKASRHPYAFMPFGLGPRNCIGMRFSMIEAKVAVAHLVHTFKLEPCEKTTIPMKFGGGQQLKPKDGTMWLKVTPRGGI